MREVLSFAAGLVLALLFAMAAVFALAGTWSLLIGLVEARGDAGAFEAHVRHLTDSIDLAEDGSIVLHREPHPIAKFLVMILAAWAVTIACARAISWLGKRRLRA